MATIDVDGQKLEAADDANLLEVCLSYKLDLPYFCWHPAMGSVGSCRQCAVRVYADEKDQRGKILMACMTPVQDGMRLSIKEPGVSQFRDQCIEVTMANHPHDCPVCEEGGECHLQDMTIMSHYTTRRYRGKKKTYQNQYLGPCIGHEMNRCIACYRCVRFYNDYAGGEDLTVMASRENVYFGRFEEGCLESKFSGNLVEVCPTGVFTDKTLSREYSRKWDLQTAPSICEGCSLGCNIAPSERYGKIKRIVNRYHYDINGYFLCDRGRFGYDHINHNSRVRQCLHRQQNAKVIDYDDAIALTADLLSDLDHAKVFGIGSDRASVEENVLLQQLVGAESFCSGWNAQQHQLNQCALNLLRDPKLQSPTLREIEDCDAILILGEDIMNTAPRMALSVRQATRNAGLELARKARIPLWQDASVRTITQDLRSPVINVTVSDTELDELACESLHLNPDAIADFGLALAQAIEGKSGGGKRAYQESAQRIAEILITASNPMVIAGTSVGSIAVLHAAQKIAKALGAKSKQPGKLALVLAQANSLGLAIAMGESGCNLEQVLVTVTGNPNQYSLIILQNDLNDLSQDQQQQLLGSCKHSIVIEQHATDVARRAELLIPAKAVVETEGTFVNNEGRAQRFFEVYAASNDQLKDNWKTLVNFARAQCNRKPNARLQAMAALEHFDDVVNFVSGLAEEFNQWRQVAPNSHLRIAGMKVPRQPHRYSGRTSIHADKKVAENKQPQDEDSALTFSMEGAPINVPPSLNAIVWSPGWNSNEAVNKFQDEVDGHLSGGDPGLRIIKKHAQTQDTDQTIDRLLHDSNQLLAVAEQRLFDGDRRVAMSQALVQRADDLVLQINAQTAKQLNLRDRQNAIIKLNGLSTVLRVAINNYVADNTVLVPNSPTVQEQFPLASLPAVVEVEAS